MYLSALELLEEEREAFRPYEALAGLTDAELAAPTAADGPGMGWSGRDLAAHIVAWLEIALTIARELAISPRSATHDGLDAAAAAVGGWDEWNRRQLETWRALPIEEVRRRLVDVPGELRGTLTVVPEIRWLKDAAISRFFIGDTIDHYEDHLPVLGAVLRGAGR